MKDDNALDVWNSEKCLTNTKENNYEQICKLELLHGSVDVLSTGWW